MPGKFNSTRKSFPVFSKYFYFVTAVIVTYLIDMKQIGFCLHPILHAEEDYPEIVKKTYCKQK